MSKPKHPACIHFKIAFEQLQRDEKFKTKELFAKSISSYNHLVNEIMQGKRAPTLQNITLLATKYNVSPTFIVIGRGSIYMGDELLTTSEPVVAYGEMENLRQEVKYLKQINQLLQEKSKSKA